MGYGLCHPPGRYLRGKIRLAGRLRPASFPPSRRLTLPVGRSSQQDLASAMEVENVGPNEDPSNLSNEGELKTIRGNKRKNHRGGQKKKGRKGPKACNQDTAAGSKGKGAIMEDRGDAVRMDAGEGSNATTPVLHARGYADFRRCVLSHASTGLHRYQCVYTHTFLPPLHVFCLVPRLPSAH